MTLQTALCGAADLDPFTDNADELSQVLALCRDCPIRAECRERWHDAPTLYGVWGGLRGVDLARRELARRRLER